MNQTTNYNLVKPELTDSPPDITVMNPNWDKIDAKLRDNEEQIENLGAYGVASGINAYTAAITGITTLTEGFTVRIKFTNANTGASTLNINSLGAKSILRGNGSTLSSGNIKAGQICNLAYTGSNFQLLGEGGEYGTATASDVLAGKTIGTEEGIITGIMPNCGAVNQNLTSEGQEYTIPSGYHNGLGKIKAVITGLVASVIKAGTTVGDILGTFTSDATATASQMLVGAIAYVNGNKVTGTIPSKEAQTYTPGTTNKTIVSGQYLSGVQTIQGSPNLVPENIKKGVPIFNVTGSYSGDLEPDFTFNDLINANIQYVDISGSTTYIMPANTSWYLVDILEYTIDGAYASYYIRNKAGHNIFSALWEKTLNNNISDFNIIMSNSGENYEINTITTEGAGARLRVYYIDITSLNIKSIGVGGNTSDNTIPYDCLITNAYINTSGSSLEGINLSVKIGESKLYLKFITGARTGFCNPVGIVLQNGEIINCNGSIANVGAIWGRTFDTSKYSIIKVQQSGLSSVNYQLPAGYKYIAVSAAINGTNVPLLVTSPASSSYLMPRDSLNNSRTTIQNRILPASTFITSRYIYSSPGLFRFSALRTPL